jgi:hypothetical protein
MNMTTAKNACNKEFLILVNPTNEDTCILGKQIRFTADGRTKTVYAWSFNVGHHGDVSISLNIAKKQFKE